MFTRAVILLLVACACKSRFLGRTSNIASSGKSDKNNRKPSCLLVRGGSSVETENTEIDWESPCTLTVSTSIGSSFLDKRKKIIVARNSSVSELKILLQEKFAGSPPPLLQRIFLGVRLLRDDEVIGTLSPSSTIPLLLDVITGTSSYNKKMVSVSQALEAYTSLNIHQIYLGNQMMQLYKKLRQHGNEDESITNRGIVDVGETVLETALYRDLLESVNASLYEKYAEDISNALEAESEPESESTDTDAWRRSGNAKRMPVEIAFAKEFGLNFNGLKQVVYNSLICLICARYGTSQKWSSKAFVLFVPFLWISNLRQLRLVFKVATYLFLQIVPHLEFLLPLLPAPQQVIALESRKWGGCSFGRSSEDRKEDENGHREDEYNDLDVGNENEDVLETTEAVGVIDDEENQEEHFVEDIEEVGVEEEGEKGGDDTDAEEIANGDGDFEVGDSNDIGDEREDVNDNNEDMEDDYHGAEEGYDESDY